MKLLHQGEKLKNVEKTARKPEPNSKNRGKTQLVLACGQNARRSKIFVLGCLKKNYFISESYCLYSIKLFQKSQTQ